MREIPALAMLTAPAARVRERAAAVSARLAGAGVVSTVVDTDASAGGGAFPTTRIPSAAVALGGDVDAHEARLRAAGGPHVPVIGRIADGRLLLDLRSVPEDADDALAAAVLAALA